MSKPYGLGWRFTDDGCVVPKVLKPTHAEDKIWDAVEAAIDEGMDAAKFRAHAAEAWEHVMAQRGKWAAEDLLKGGNDG